MSESIGHCAKVLDDVALEHENREENKLTSLFKARAFHILLSGMHIFFYFQCIVILIYIFIVTTEIKSVILSGNKLIQFEFNSKKGQ